MSLDHSARSRRTSVVRQRPQDRVLCNPERIARVGNRTGVVHAENVSAYESDVPSDIARILPGYRLLGIGNVSIDDTVLDYERAAASVNAASTARTSGGCSIVRDRDVIEIGFVAAALHPECTADSSIPARFHVSGDRSARTDETRVISADGRVHRIEVGTGRNSECPAVVISDVARNGRTDQGDTALVLHIESAPVACGLIIGQCRIDQRYVGAPGCPEATPPEIGTEVVSVQSRRPGLPPGHPVVFVPGQVSIDLAPGQRGPGIVRDVNTAAVVAGDVAADTGIDRRQQRRTGHHESTSGVLREVVAHDGPRQGHFSVLAVETAAIAFGAIAIHLTVRKRDDTGGTYPESAPLLVAVVGDRAGMIVVDPDEASRHLGAVGIETSTSLVFDRVVDHVDVGEIHDRVPGRSESTAIDPRVVVLDRDAIRVGPDDVHDACRGGIVKAATFASLVADDVAVSVDRDDGAIRIEETAPDVAEIVRGIATGAVSADRNVGQVDPAVATTVEPSPVAMGVAVVRSQADRVAHDLVPVDQGPLRIHFPAGREKSAPVSISVVVRDRCRAQKIDRTAAVVESSTVTVVAIRHESDRPAQIRVVCVQVENLVLVDDRVRERDRSVVVESAAMFVFDGVSFDRGIRQVHRRPRVGDTESPAPGPCDVVVEADAGPVHHRLGIDDVEGSALVRRVIVDVHIGQIDDTGTRRVESRSNAVEISASVLRGDVPHEVYESQVRRRVVARPETGTVSCRIDTESSFVVRDVDDRSCRTRDRHVTVAVPEPATIAGSGVSGDRTVSGNRHLTETVVEASATITAVHPVRVVRDRHIRQGDRTVVVETSAMLRCGGIRLDRGTRKVHDRPLLGDAKSTSANIGLIVPNRHVCSIHRGITAKQVEPRPFIRLVVFDQRVVEIQNAPFVHVETSTGPADSSATVLDFISRDGDQAPIVHVHRGERREVPATPGILSAVVRQRCTVHEIHGHAVVKTKAATNGIRTVSVDGDIVESRRRALAPDVDPTSVAGGVVRDRAAGDGEACIAPGTENASAARGIVAAISNRLVVGEARIRRDNGLVVVVETAAERMDTPRRDRVLHNVIVDNYICESKNVAIVVDAPSAILREKAAGDRQILNRDIGTVRDVENATLVACGRVRIDDRGHLVATGEYEILVYREFTLRKGIRRVRGKNDRISGNSHRDRFAQGRPGRFRRRVVTGLVDVDRSRRPRNRTRSCLNRLPFIDDPALPLVEATVHDSVDLIAVVGIGQTENMPLLVHEHGQQIDPVDRLLGDSVEIALVGDEFLVEPLRLVDEPTQSGSVVVDVNRIPFRAADRQSPEIGHHVVDLLQRVDLLLRQSRFLPAGQRFPSQSLQILLRKLRVGAFVELDRIQSIDFAFGSRRHELRRLRDRLLAVDLLRHFRVHGDGRSGKQHSRFERFRKKRPSFRCRALPFPLFEHFTVGTSHGAGEKPTLPTRRLRSVHIWLRGILWRF